jgi:ABC-type multidrug transport system fused ATPase/permease subunit
MLYNFKKVNLLLNSKEKKKIIFFIPLTLLLVFLETLSIGLIIPIISYLLENKSFINYDFLNPLIKSIPRNDLIIYLLIGVIIVYLVKNLYVIFYNWSRMLLANSIQLRISSQLLEVYFKALYSEIFDRNSSELLRNIQTESAKLRNIISHIIILFSEILIIFGIVILLSYINFIIIMIALSTVTLLFFFYYLIIQNTVKELGYENQKITKKFVQSILEKISSLKIIRIFLKENFFLNEFEKDMKKFQTNNLKLSIINLLPKVWIEFFGVTFLCVTFIILINKSIDMNDILALLSLIGVVLIRLIPSINRIATSLQALKYTTATFERVSHDLSIKINTRNDDKDNKIKFTDNIKMRNINFSFKRYKKNIFKELNFEIKKNSLICIKGKSGSGKSTFANLFAGLYQPDQGEFIVDGKIVRTSSLDWISKVGYVTQDTYLIDDSIRKNIAFGVEDSQIDEKKINEIIELVQLKELIKSLPDNINTIVGERGSTLSMGQIQRIGIARALYRNTDILLLDEITSSLDQINTEKIYQLIEKMKTLKTIIVITHELSNDSIFDQIYDLKNNTFQKIS